jgi:NAD+ kinase
MSSPLRILVLARDAAPHVKLAWETLAPALRQREGIEIVAVATEDDPPSDLPPVDIAMVIGGDGAILRASHHFGERQVPLLGINLGRLGFLADLSPEELIYNLDQLAHRQFRVTQHMMFECQHRRADGSTQAYLGLNEATVSAAAALAMIDVEFGIDGEWATTYSGDGVIISTPIGSTAHNLSAGGPILEQNLSAFVITPICPHTLTNRPLVVSAEHEYTFTLPRAPEGAMLVIDGQIKEPISPGDQIVMRRAAVTFPLVRVPGHSYYATLRRKLGWGGQPRYQRAP